MLKLIIEDDEGRKTVVPFVRDEITIGRQEGNTIRLTERNVSRRHARLLRQNGSVYVEDLGSYNGIRVNGEKVSGRITVNDGDLIQIGDYDLAIQREGADQPVPSAGLTGAPRPSNGAHAPAARTAPAHEPETEAAAPAYDHADPVGGDVAGHAGARRLDPEAIRHQSTSIIRVDQIEATRTRQVMEIDAEEAPRLVVLNTEFAGREFACIRSELRIGRTDDNDIALDHRSLSRTHAKIVREDTGEWRIIDMQSANGLLVNGEPYAQATLNHLDTVELGHLKLKFVAAGESWTYVPGAGDRPARRGDGGSKMPLVIGAVAVVALIAGGGAIYALVRDPVAAPAPPAPTAAPPVQVSQAAKAPKPPAPAQPDPKAQAEAEAKQKLEAARAAVAALDFDRAVGLLEGVQGEEAQELREGAQAEQLMRERLNEAEQAMEAGRLEEAESLLAEAGSTRAFAERHEALSEELGERVVEERRRKAAVAAASARTSQAKKEPGESAPPAADVQALFEQGRNQLQNDQVTAARATLQKCVELNPRYANCHLLLGAALAKLRETDAGARHYEVFLKLAPDAPEAPKVQLFLEQYKRRK